MSKALYNKYRSQDFDSLIGQDHITNILKNSIIKDRIANAYLFVGSRGTGKTSTARIMAKALNCTAKKEDGNPCDKCSNCKGVTAGNFVDLIEIDAASNRGIDQIRELKERIEFAPAEGRFKIYIIDEVHMLTKEAFNALLKTLEEPPKHIVFILATTDIHKLPPTILSRCQRYDFRLGNEKQIEKTLLSVVEKENIKIDEAALKILVDNAKGSYRDALSLLDVVMNAQSTSENNKHISEVEVQTALGIPDFKVVNSLFECLMTNDSSLIFDILLQIEQGNININQLVFNLVNLLNSKLVESVKAKDTSSINKIISLIELFLKIDKDIKYSSYPFTLLQSSLISYTFKGEVNTEKKSINIPSETKEVKKENVVVERKTEEKKVEIKEEQKPKDIVEDTDESDDTGEENDQGSDVAEKIALSMELIKQKWEEIIVSLKSMSPRLAVLLKSSTPLSVNGKILSLSVPYQFHKDTLDNLSNKEILVMSIKKIFNCDVKVDISVDSSMKNKKKASSDILMKAREISATTVEKKEDNSKPVHVISDAQKEERKAKFTKKVEEIFAGM